MSNSTSHHAGLRPSGYYCCDEHAAWFIWEVIPEVAVEAAAREQWRQEHGRISSHDSDRTPESDERESAEDGYRQWDRGTVAEPVKDGYRRRARAVLTAALEHLPLLSADGNGAVA